MVVICNIYKSVNDLLPHFLDHYFSYGVSQFSFGIHGGQSNPVWNEIHTRLPISISLFKSYDGDIDGRREGEGLNMLRINAPSPWVIPADLDEFHIPPFLNFKRLIEECEKEHADYVSSTLIDRISEDGTIPPSISSDPINKQFPQHVDITGKILGASKVKICLSRQKFPINNGHHYLGEGSQSGIEGTNPFSSEAVTNHYKWFGDLYAKELEKFKSYKSKGLSYHSENQKLMEYLTKHGGKLL
jgi:hypothetical protein